MDDHLKVSGGKPDPKADAGVPEASVLIRASRVLNSTLDLPQLHDEVLRLLSEACSVPAAVLLLVERKTQDFVLLRGYHRKTDAFTDFPPRVAHRLFSWVQSENPAGSDRVKPLPARVEAALGKLVGLSGGRYLWSALRRRGRVSGAVGIIFTGDDQPKRGAVLSVLSDQIATALDNALLFRAVKRRSTEARILLQSTMALSGSLDLDEILKTILDRLREVIHYDAAGIFLMQKDTAELAPIIDRGFDEDKRPLLQRKSDEGLVGYAVSTGETVVAADVRWDPRYKNARDATRSELVIPISVAGRLIGAFDLERDVTEGFSTDDVRLAAAFAGSAGVAIERARLYQESLEKQRLDGELEIARSIQQTFLPKKNPSVPRYDIAGMNVSSEEVGGDYYDFISIVDHQLGIAIGDVSGKGIPAALIMAAFRASLIAEIRNNYAIRTIFAKVNALLEETSERGTFVTAMYGVLDSKNGVFTFANAGHNPGLLLRGDDTVEQLTEGGLPFGILPQAEYEERPVWLRSGDVMLWYTDGVTEAANEEGEQFGSERVEEVLKKNRRESAGQILHVIQREVTGYAAPDSTMDDMTMIVVKAL